MHRPHKLKKIRYRLKTWVNAHLKRDCCHGEWLYNGWNNHPTHKVLLVWTYKHNARCRVAPSEEGAAPKKVWAWNA